MNGTRGHVRITKSSVNQISDNRGCTVDKMVFATTEFYFH